MVECRVVGVKCCDGGANALTCQSLRHGREEVGTWHSVRVNVKYLYFNNKAFFGDGSVTPTYVAYHILVMCSIVIVIFVVVVHREQERSSK